MITVVSVNVRGMSGLGRSVRGHGQKTKFIFSELVGPLLSSLAELIGKLHCLITHLPQFSSVQSSYLYLARQNKCEVSTVYWLPTGFHGQEVIKDFIGIFHQFAY